MKCRRYKEINKIRKNNPKINQLDQLIKIDELRKSPTIYDDNVNCHPKISTTDNSLSFRIKLC